MADPTRFYFHPDLSNTRFWNVSFHQFEVSAGSADLRCLHFHMLIYMNRLSGCLYPQVKYGRSYFPTSKMISNSTGAPSGRLATPNTERHGFLSLPKTFCNSSEAPSATFG